ncbi:MAG TPA: hypothetical protein VH475_08565 [Tepidisphaeraceae bacterium]|jgi:hypothetical protein
MTARAAPLIPLTLAIILLLSRAASGQATQPYSPPLLAYGAPDRYWIATVEPWKDGARTRTRTLVRGQILPAGDWQDLDAVYGRAVALAQIQGDLAILLDDGSWRRLGIAGLATGTLIPGAGPVLAWGSSPKELYAVRAVEGGRAAVTTRPTSATQSTLTTRPATRPTQLALLRFEQGQWVGVADLPGSVTGAPLSLAVAGSKPLLAAQGTGGTIRTMTWSDDRWQEFGEIALPNRAAAFGVLAVGTLPAVWTIDPQGGMRLFLKREGEEWEAAKGFAFPKSLPANAPRVLAAAGQEFRLVAIVDGKLQEARFDLGGLPRGELTALPAPVGSRPDVLYWVMRAAVLLGLVAVMFLTFYRRQEPSKDVRDDQ